MQRGCRDKPPTSDFWRMKLAVCDEAGNGSLGHSELEGSFRDGEQLVVDAVVFHAHNLQVPPRHA